MSARTILLRALLVLGLVTPGWALGKVFRCVDPVTKAVMASDMPCKLDGPTPAEAAASAEAARVAAIDREIRKAAERADRQLLEKFPDRSALRHAYVVELEGVIGNIDRARKRLGQLVVERKPLDEEARFYIGKPLPAVLKRSIDASEASFAALADVFREQELKTADIVARYASERERLGRLWGGAAPGSMGALGTAVAASSPR